MTSTAPNSDEKKETKQDNSAALAGSEVPKDVKEEGKFRRLLRQYGAIGVATYFGVVSVAITLP